MQAYSISPGAQVSIGEPQPRTHGPRTRAASRATSCRADTAPRFPDRTLMHIIRPAACGRSVEASCQVASSHDLSIAMQTDDLYMPEPQINVQQSPLTDHASAQRLGPTTSCTSAGCRDSSRTSNILPGFSGARRVRSYTRPRACLKTRACDHA